MYVYKCVQECVHVRMPWCACAGQIPILGMEGSGYSGKEKSLRPREPREHVKLLGYIEKRSWGKGNPWAGQVYGRGWGGGVTGTE